ncbi:MAG: trehalase family glycosidase [Dongiaceae bacterium]
MNAQSRDADLYARAERILRDNDRGGYTVPTKGLYPFQWNWDSCLTALGQRHFDEARAWTEIETLLAHQWADGMVPHIVFHEIDEGYFPGPGVWQCGGATPTSGITQPPVLGFVLQRLYAEARDRQAARTRALTLVPKADAWHHWFYTHRDPRGSGLVAILHPWESGRDNSVDWDAALMRVPADGVAPYRRRDTEHVDAAERPTQAEYDRYLWLVQHFRGLGWNNAELHDASPFRVVDPGFNAILVRSDSALAELAEAIGLGDIATRARARVSRARAAFPALWNEDAGQFVCLDRVTGEQIDSRSIGGLLPAFAGLGDMDRLADTIAARRSYVTFGVPSHDPADVRFEKRRYWRGPVWLIVNQMLADGLRRYGRAEAADAIVADSMALIHLSGFAEYYDPTDGGALGGPHFTWTAAMVMELLVGKRG